MNPLEKEKLLDQKRKWKNRWCSSLNPEDKEKLLSKRAEWYKSLETEEKPTKKHTNSQLNMIWNTRAQFFKIRSGKVHIIFVLFVTDYYTEKLLFI